MVNEREWVGSFDGRRRHWGMVGTSGDLEGLKVVFFM
jgi:hypothetical protein